jgi:regulator of protease activity HflC (stomatin/prohibitin superfamily)
LSLIVADGRSEPKTLLELYATMTLPAILNRSREPADNDGRAPPRAPLAKIVMLAAAGIVTLLVVSLSYFTVAQYERAVVSRFGRLNYVAEPGLHFKMPFMDTVRTYRVDIQQFTTAKLNTYTVDNQEVDATLTVQWQLPVDQVAFIFTNTPDPGHQLEAMVIDRFKVEGGRINVTEFANNRGALVKKVYDIVRDEADRLYHIRVTDVQLPNLDYQPSFRDAQAQAAVVKTQIEQAQGLKLKADIDATTVVARASGEANAAIQAARGRAESVRLEAEAGAHATLIRGQAETEVQKLMAAALSQNATLVEYQKALRWNGQLPQAIYAGAPIPFLQAPAAAR